MKKIHKFLLFGALAALGFTACSVDEFEGDREPSPVSTTGEVQAFIHDETPGSMTFKPTAAQEFSVKVGRANADAAVTVALAIDNPGSAFTLPASVTFPAGALEAEIPVSFSFGLGQSADLTVGFDSVDAYPYGLKSVTITVLRDYDWVAAGVAELTSDFFGATFDVNVEQAVGASPKRYRLVNPMYTLIEDAAIAPEGFHWVFELDSTNNYAALSFPPKQNLGIDAAAVGVSGGDGLFIDAKEFTNNGTTFTVVSNYLISAGGTLTGRGYGGVPDVFVWKEGFPGTLPNVSYSSTLTTEESIEGWELVGADTVTFLEESAGIAMIPAAEAAKITSPAISIRETDTLTFAYNAAEHAYWEAFYAVYDAEKENEEAAFAAADAATAGFSTTINVYVLDYGDAKLVKTITETGYVDGGAAAISLSEYKGKPVKIAIEVTSGDATIAKFGVANTGASLF